MPGAGSGGRVWEEARALLGAAVLPLPDATDIPSMAELLLPDLEPFESPVLVGASAGAMVALEVARRRRVAALVLIAAGFGITVSDPLLSWVASAPPDLFPKMARASIADHGDARALALAVEDFELRGAEVSYRHLRALGAYRPEPLPEPPPTAVIWGVLDHSVPAIDHLELAAQCRGILIPIPGAAHMPFLERPKETVHWIRDFVSWRLR